MAAEDFQMTLARTMRQHREGLSVSQEGFADSIGVHRTYYSSVERGERNVSLKNLLKIAAGLGVPLSQLIADAERWKVTSEPKRKAKNS